MIRSTRQENLPLMQRIQSCGTDCRRVGWTEFVMSGVRILR